MIQSCSPFSVPNVITDYGICDDGRIYTVLRAVQTVGFYLWNLKIDAKEEGILRTVQRM